MIIAFVAVAGLMCAGTLSFANEMSSMANEMKSEMHGDMKAGADSMKGEMKGKSDAMKA
jgi:hypothetical protein